MSGPADASVAAPPGPDPDELGRVLGAHRAAVASYAARHTPPDLRPLTAPEDVWQDVCLETFRRFVEFRGRPPDEVRRLLLTIARCKLVDAVRAGRATKRGGGLARVEDLRREQGGESMIPLLEQLAVYERTPSRSAIAHEAAAIVQRSLARLPTDYALCVRLRHIEQRTVPETAGLMGRTNGATEQLCRRALLRLRADLLRAVAPA